MSGITSYVTEFASPLSLCLVVVGALAVKVLFFVFEYVKARRQFPGPPVANFWTGNLTETLTEDVHEKWRRWHREFGPVYQTVCC